MVRYFLWSHIHTLPRWLQRVWQLYFFNQIYRYALRHVRMYQVLYGKACREKIADLNEVAEIPTLNKKYIVATKEADRFSNSIAATASDWKETSGSTGVPLHFPLNSFYAKSVRDKRYLTMARYRFLCWREGRSFREAVAVIQAQRLYHIGFDAYTTKPKAYRFTSLTDLRRDPQATIKSIATFAPTLLESLPTTLVMLAKLNNKRSKPITCSYVYAIGEVLTDSQRTFIEQSFQAEVFNGYGMEEVGMIALECREHNGLHVSEESFLLEVVDDTNKPVRDGEIGNIILTHFWNQALPFIRYESGDAGYVMPEPCACGIPSRRIVVYGRVGGTIACNGMEYSHLELARVIEELHQYIQHFQWVYDGSTITLLVQYYDAVTTVEEKQVRSHIASWLGFVPSIEVTNTFMLRNGKIPVVVETTNQIPA